MQHSRRNFIGKVAGGLAGTLAASSVLGANDRIRIGIIGAGDRGLENARAALACPNTEIAAVADLYPRRLDEARTLAPSARLFTHYQDLLAHPAIDAVLISTPHHLHCEHFTAALSAAKHVYQEKTMAFTVDHAKRMRAAHLAAPTRVIQIGHQQCSSGQIEDAATFLSSGGLGQITAIRATMFRNTPHGKPQWTRPIHPDVTESAISWPAFQGEAPPTPFDPNRFVNWRHFFSYSGGNVHENMCHQLAFWYKSLNLQIPHTVNMSGGIYLWNDGREVPDTMAVAMQHGSPDTGSLLFTWDSGFGNNQPGIAEEVLGTDGTISKSQQIRYIPQKVNRPEAKESLGLTRTLPNAHMQNFFDCIRAGRSDTNAPFDLGFRVSIACRMAVESYLQQRTVTWNAATEEIV